jgi:putative transposase
MTPGGLDAEEQIQRTSDHCDPESGGSRTDGKRRLSGAQDQRATYYQWKLKYGGMEAADIRRLPQLEEEDLCLK